MTTRYKVIKQTQDLAELQPIEKLTVVLINYATGPLPDPPMPVGHIVYKMECYDNNRRNYHTEGGKVKWLKE